MKLRATISIEFDAEDVFDARRQQHAIAARVQALEETGLAVKLAFTERRPRVRPRAPAPSRAWS